VERGSDRLAPVVVVVVVVVVAVRILVITKQQASNRHSSTERRPRSARRDELSATCRLWRCTAWSQCATSRSQSRRAFGPESHIRQVDQ
jgi:hypothetical protein